MGDLDLSIRGGYGSFRPGKISKMGFYADSLVTGLDWINTEDVM